jgi:type II secretory pathway pseudopilin PulG
MSQVPPQPPTVPQPVVQTPRGSGLAIAALVLAIVGLLAWPLGIAALVVGLIALARATSRKGLAITAVVLGVLELFTCVAIGPAMMLPALGNARQAARQIKSSTQLRTIGQGLMIYAQNNQDWYPEAGADWQQRLIDAGLVPPEVFEAPGARPGQPSYYYVPGHQSKFSSTTILLYENPDLWNGRGGNVYYDDGHTEWIEGTTYRQTVESLPGEAGK